MVETASHQDADKKTDSREYYANGAQEIFFNAMQKGYAVSAEPEKGKDIPGSSFYRYVEGDWTLVDQYIVGVHGMSAGWTTITCSRTAIWCMQYWGRYDRSAIHFLRSILAKTYREKQFFGGRGPRFVEDISCVGVALPGAMKYQNMMNMEGFRSFSGREQIYTVEAPADSEGFMTEPDKKLLGYHEYRGGILFI
jgi:hypothetical protein